MYIHTWFKITELGEAKLFIGINIERDRIKREVYIDQNHYAKSTLQEFNIQDCSPTMLPIIRGTIILRDTERRVDDDITSYAPSIPSNGRLFGISNELYTSRHSIRR